MLTSKWHAGVGQRLRSSLRATAALLPGAQFAGDESLVSEFLTLPFFAFVLKKVFSLDLG